MIECAAMKTVGFLLLLSVFACKEKGSTDAPSSTTVDSTVTATNPAASGTEAGKPMAGETAVGSILLKVPASWKAVPITSSMRRGHWTISEGTELIAYYFGKGGAGGTEANLDRWYSQFTQPDKRPSKEVAERKTMKTAGGQDAIVVDVSGQYVAAMQPGGTEKNDKPNYRMLAAIVPGPDGPYYFKLLGPSDAVATVKADFTAAITSIRGGAMAKPSGASHPTP